MYLHIGNETLIKSKDIIGIFNLDYIGNTKEYRNLYNRLKNENKLYNISEKDGRTLILSKREDKEEAYLTNVGVYTIVKRLI